MLDVVSEELNRYLSPMILIFRLLGNVLYYLNEH